MILNWKKLVCRTILYNLFMYGAVSGAVADDFLGEGNSPGVTVRVKSEDAQRQRSFDLLRREAAEARQALVKLEAENRALRESEKRLRENMVDLTNKYQEQNERYRQLRLVLSDALASEKVRGVGEREEQLLRVVSDIAVNGGDLAIKTVKFCELVDSITHDLPIGKVRQAELRLRLDELMRDSRRFISLTMPETDKEALKKCRILAVDRDLSVVVLPVGTVHGAFNGLKYYAGKSQAVLKVVSVRPFVAAAQLISGNIDDLAPGMEVATENK